MMDTQTRFSAYPTRRRAIFFWRCSLFLNVVVACISTANDLSASSIIRYGGNQDHGALHKRFKGHPTICKELFGLCDTHRTNDDRCAAPQRLTEPPPGEWVEPGNYVNGSTDWFMRGELHKWDQSPNGGHYGEHLVRWGTEVEVVGRSGVRGCVEVIVISRRGVMMIHFPGLKALWGSLRLTGDGWDKRWRADIDSYYVSELHHGSVPNYIGIDYLRSQGDDRRAWRDPLRKLFNDDAKPRAFFMVADDRWAQAGEERFMEDAVEMNIFSHELKSIFAPSYDIPIRLLPYHPIPYENCSLDLDADPFYQTPRNKILVQYQPPPQRSGKAKYRIWLEGGLVEHDIGEYDRPEYNKDNISGMDEWTPFTDFKEGTYQVADGGNLAFTDAEGDGDGDGDESDEIVDIGDFSIESPEEVPDEGDLDWGE